MLYVIPEEIQNLLNEMKQLISAEHANVIWNPGIQEFTIEFWKEGSCIWIGAVQKDKDNNWEILTIKGELPNELQPYKKNILEVLINFNTFRKIPIRDVKAMRLPKW